MADDVYRRAREARIAALTAETQRLAPEVEIKRVTIGPTRVFRRGRSQPLTDYVAFKAALAPAVEEIKVEIRAQHEQTRAEVQTTRADLLAAVKASPSQYIKLACEFGALFLLLSLTIRFTLEIELVNTAFALFMLPCLVVYWVMADVKQRSEKRNGG
jgi:hypothetical protein